MHFPPDLMRKGEIAVELQIPPANQHLPAAFRFAGVASVLRIWPAVEASLAVADFSFWRSSRSNQNRDRV
jgi:hypothetical protein